MKRGVWGGVTVAIVLVLMIGAFQLGQGVADESVLIGDVSEVAECLGVSPRDGAYHVSDILCRLAGLLGHDCCSSCPSPPLPPNVGEVTISRVLANAPGSTSSAEIPNEFIALRNDSECPVDLRGCSIGDENGSWTIPASRSDAILYPGNEIAFYGREYNPSNSSQGIALRNSGETVWVRCGNLLIDSWRYPDRDGEIHR